MFEFKHPKYYKELRKLRNKLAQVISEEATDGFETSVHPGPGLKQQATSDKPHALHNNRQASSRKLQAP